MLEEDTSKTARAKEVAEQSILHNTAFLAALGHEVRTPMSAILGITEIHLRNGSLSAETEEAFTKIYESGNLLLHVFNDVLDLTKIEAGELEILPAQYDIPNLLNDILRLNLPRYENKQIDFTLDIDKNTPLWLLGDCPRIKQILNNVLANVVKYSDNGKIELFITSEDGQNNEDTTLVLRVSDSKQVMTKEQVNKFFGGQVFNTQTDSAAVSAAVSVGLSMSVAKNLIEMMNGSINIESLPEKGLVFTVRIPQKRVDSRICGEDLAESLNDLNLPNTSLTKKKKLKREHMPYGRVLIVDDVGSNIYVAKGMLLPYGLKIDTATGGLEAVEKIKEGNVYDIIFMDHMMPDMDGIEATKNIRETGYKDTIVAFTANVGEGVEEMFLTNGFDGFISKPIDSRELDRIVNTFIRDKKQAKETAITSS